MHRGVGLKTTQRNILKPIMYKMPTEDRLIRGEFKKIIKNLLLTVSEEIKLEWLDPHN